MKNLKIKWSNILFNAVVAILFALAVGVNPFVMLAGSLVVGAAMGFYKPLTGALHMAIQKEIWERDIVENFFKDNQFLRHAFNADQYVLQGKVVHIPNAGAPANVEKNRSDLPAEVSERTDVDITYRLDEFTSDPILIPHADTVELSYDKRQSVTAEAQAKLREEVADAALSAWAPAVANHIATTGTDKVDATAPLATGVRKKIVLDDLKAAMKKMNKDDVPQAGRYALFSAEMYDQFLSDLTSTQYRDFSMAFNPATGVLGSLYGFQVMMRSSVLVYKTNDDLQTGNGAATDREAVLCWQQNSVERALGEVKFFENIGDATYYGDIYSFLLRFGGRIRRDDKKGVYAIVQEITTA